MAHCPKCNTKLKVFDLKPTCKNCGINIMYYNMEERLEADAQRAEEEWAKVEALNKSVRRSAVGSAVAVIRLVLMTAYVCAFVPFVIRLFGTDTNMSMPLVIAGLVLAVGQIISALYSETKFGMVRNLFLGLASGAVFWLIHQGRYDPEGLIGMVLWVLVLVFHVLYEQRRKKQDIGG